MSCRRIVTILAASRVLRRMNLGVSTSASTRSLDVEAIEKIYPLNAAEAGAAHPRLGEQALPRRIPAEED